LRPDRQADQLDETDRGLMVELIAR